MGQGVINQIAQQLIEQCWLASQPHRLVRFQRQSDTALVGQRGHGHAQLSRQLTQIQQLRAPLGDRSCAVFDSRQRKQLIGQMGQAIRALGGSFQRTAPGIGLSRTHAQFQSRL